MVGVGMFRQVARQEGNMDPVFSAISAIQTILDISKQVHANRQSAISLAGRCSNLSLSLENLRSQHPFPPNFANLVEVLGRILDEIDRFLRKFIKPTSSYFDQLLWYGMLANDHRSHLNSFADFGNQIDKAISDLSVEVLVNGNQSLEAVQQNRTQDCQGVRDDLENLAQSVNDFRQELRASPSSAEVLNQYGNQLQDCQAQFHDILTRWDETVGEITRLKDLVRDISNQLKSQQQQSPSEEIRNELTAIRGIIEDLTFDGGSSPQQALLIESLNDSFVHAITSASASTQRIFYKEFLKLEKAAERFHEESHKKSDEILASIQRLEFTDREKTIREHRLSQLTIYQKRISLTEDILGTGAFGEVRRGTYERREVAVKVIKSRGGPFNDTEKRAIENEILLMSHCSFPSILHLYGFCQVEHRSVYLVLELCPLGSLWSYLSDETKHPSIPLALSVAWIADIFSALSYLHDRGIIHRDVKAENVLLSDRLECKLTDFGLSKHQMESSLGGQSTKAQGTLLFMAPETRSDSLSTHRSDVYSVGVTAYQILKRAAPPSQRTRVAIVNFFKSLHPEPLGDLLTLCLEEDRKKRVSSSDGLEMISRLQESDASLRDPRTDDRDTQQFQRSSATAASAPPPSLFQSTSRNLNIVPLDSHSHEELWVMLLLLSLLLNSLSLPLTSFDLLHSSINVAGATKEHLGNWKG
jgi:serine/threonine protein kinase